MEQKSNRENILRWFQDTAERRGSDTCLQFKKNKIWQTLSWDETLKKIQNISEAFKKLNITKMDRVSILANTRYEWSIYDMAILSLGAVTVPIYQSNLPEECQHILHDSESKVVVVEDAIQLKKILQVKSQLPNLEKIILMEGESGEESVIGHEAFEKMGEGEATDFGARIRQILHEDLATLVYTSGTTGKPKGVMLTHANILGEVKGMERAVPVSPEYVSLIFLPLAHILARVVQFYQFARGFTHAYAESIEKLGENIQEVRPHFMVSVPRIFEKIYSGMMAQVQAGSSTKQAIFYWAKHIGEQYSKCLQQKKPVPMGIKVKHGLAHKLVFSKLHKKLGGRLKFFVSGGAPLSKDIAEFFHGAGILILEGYGLSETTAAVNVTMLEDYEFGTVGKPMLGVEEKIAEDGEILVKGPMIGKGYWNRPEATAEVFQEDGWFHTGDIGEFTEAGNLRITDRKKDIIVTAGGKNIAPQNIENMIKTHPLISQVVVHGDKRKFVTALITLNPEELPKKATELGLAGKDFSQLTQDPKVKELIKGVIDEFNKKLPSYETIKKFAILDKDFSIEDGELTPTLKVKRKVINERYKSILDGFYD